MPSYLERYQQGEYVQVWKELVAVGDTVRTEPLYRDARAVAQETMRRARHNLDLLVQRLQDIGYEFEYPELIMEPPTADLIAEVDAFEREIGPIPLSLRAWVEIVGSVNLMGSYPRLSTYHANDNPQFEIGGPGGSTQVVDIDTMFNMIQQDMEKAPDMLPPGLKNMFGMLENLMPQFQSQQAEEKKERKAIAQADRVESDPLVFEAMEISIEAYEEWQEYEDEPYHAILAPDVFHKSGVSGGDGYAIVLPNAAADAPLLNTEWRDVTFVQYLRLSFKWAGFPGLYEYDRRDEALLTALKEGFLPL